jgi:hypothetical protein
VLGREFPQSRYNGNRDKKGLAAIAAGPFLFSGDRSLQPI